MDKSSPTDGDSLRNSLTKFKANNLSLLAKAELTIGRESLDSKAIMESYYGLQHLFICTIAIELLVFILMNSADIVINNE